MATDDMLTMSTSSPQAQRAIRATSGRFLDELRTTCARFAADDAMITVHYRSDLHMGVKAA